MKRFLVLLLALIATSGWSASVAPQVGLNSGSGGGGGSGFSNPMSQANDLIIGGSGGAAVVLHGPTGTGTYALTSTPSGGVAGALSWTVLTVNNFTASTNPGVSNDNTQGYSVGSAWVNTSTNTAFFATNVGTGVAVWTPALGGHLPNVQFFTTNGSYTWTKPYGATVANVYAIGGGGGGGSGSNQSGAISCGGGGGAPGAYSFATVQLISANTTEAVVVGLGGPGGATQATASSTGHNGTGGTASAFGTVGAADYVVAGGGGPGNGGSTSSGTGGTAGFGMTAQPTTVAGGAASVSGGVGTAGNTLPSVWGGAGGAGGGCTAAPVAAAGGAGGSASINYNDHWNALLPAGGAATGATGATGASIPSGMIGYGQGGAGGGGNATGVGGTGGAGGKAGAGGGGGGSSGNNGGSGTGGAGADGMIAIICSWNWEPDDHVEWIDGDKEAA